VPAFALEFLAIFIVKLVLDVTADLVQFFIDQLDHVKVIIDHRRVGKQFGHPLGAGIAHVHAYGLNVGSELSEPALIGVDLFGATTGTVILGGFNFHHALPAYVLSPRHLEALDSLGMVNVTGLHPESLLVTCFWWNKYHRTDADQFRLSITFAGNAIARDVNANISFSFIS
jgi:hypothetical protein